MNYFAAFFACIGCLLTGIGGLLALNGVGSAWYAVFAGLACGAVFLLTSVLHRALGI